MTFTDAACRARSRRRNDDRSIGMSLVRISAATTAFLNLFNWHNRRNLYSRQILHASILRCRRC